MSTATNCRFNPPSPLPPLIIPLIKDAFCQVWVIGSVVLENTIFDCTQFVSYFAIKSPHGKERIALYLNKLHESQSLMDPLCQVQMVQSHWRNGSSTLCIFAIPLDHLPFEKGRIPHPFT